MIMTAMVIMILDDDVVRHAGDDRDQHADRHHHHRGRGGGGRDQRRHLEPETGYFFFGGLSGSSAMFGVLGMSKAQMVADLEAKPEALDALMSLADSLEELEAWFQAGADFCTAGKTRILIATAVVAEGDPPSAAA